jgi:Probable zinc-ribbon domain
MSQHRRPLSVLADPTQWSDKSKQSVAYGFTREYTDQPYRCWHCQTDCVFAAQDQKFTFEVQKASIDQRRTLCTECWSESNRIRAALRDCEEQWIAAREMLKIDRAFLVRWSELLVGLEAYVPYKPDTAKMNMLSKLLKNA